MKSDYLTVSGWSRGRMLLWRPRRAL